MRTLWIALYVNGNDASYFDSFGVGHIPKEIQTLIRDKNIITNIYRIQAYDLIMCGYFCIGFIDFMLIGKICYIIQIYFLLTNRKGMIQY